MSRRLGHQYADFYRGNIASYVTMFNGYADLGTWYGVTPYVGAGVGFAYNKLFGMTDTGFAAVPALRRARSAAISTTAANGASPGA